jgi:hypothetical protein
MNEVKGVRYPEVRVQLSGEDGNVFAILGAVRRGLIRAEIPERRLSGSSARRRRATMTTC